MGRYGVEEDESLLDDREIAEIVRCRTSEARLFGGGKERGESGFVSSVGPASRMAGVGIALRALSLLKVGGLGNEVRGEWGRWCGGEPSVRGSNCLRSVRVALE